MLSDAIEQKLEDVVDRVWAGLSTPAHQIYRPGGAGNRPRSPTVKAAAQISALKLAAPHVAGKGRSCFCERSPCRTHFFAATKGDHACPRWRGGDARIVIEVVGYTKF
jgi:hypothetical protein